MALHPNFPALPYAIPEPDQRWFPASEDLRDMAYETLPPLVANIRDAVTVWRDTDHATAVSADSSGNVSGFIYVDQQGFEQQRPASMAALAAGFRDYQPEALDG